MLARMMVSCAWQKVGPLRRIAIPKAAKPGPNGENRTPAVGKASQFESFKASQKRACLVNI